MMPNYYLVGLGRKYFGLIKDQLQRIMGQFVKGKKEHLLRIKQRVNQLNLMVLQKENQLMVTDQIHSVMTIQSHDKLVKDLLLKQILQKRKCPLEFHQFRLQLKSMLRMVNCQTPIPQLMNFTMVKSCQTNFLHQRSIDFKIMLKIDLFIAE